MTLPLLLINGRFDSVFPLETSQQAFFDLLGTPIEDKKHVLLDAGHGLLPENEVKANVADWLDARFGPVNKVSN